VPFPILNASARLACCHQAGTVTLIPSQSTVLVGGAPAMVAGDIAGSPVVACPVVPSPASKPCTTATVPPIPGATVSMKVMIGGRPVVLGNPALTGITDAAPVPCPVLTVQFPGQTTVLAS
jgi:hypothetical protein